MSYSYEYPRASVTADCIVFGYDRKELKILLIQRKKAPFKNRWAFPGGFIEMNETLEQSALRELKEETGIGNVFLEQLYTFGDPGRDPRGRTITVAYYALVRPEVHQVSAQDDAMDVKWFELSKIPPLAFDHKKILAIALARLSSKVRYQPVGFELLPQKFTLSELQNLYEAILQRPLDKRNFRKKFLKLGLLSELSERQERVAHRAAALYRFDRKNYDKLTKSGLVFEI